MGRLRAAPARLAPMPPKLQAPVKYAEPFYMSRDWYELRRQKKALGSVWCVDCGSTKRLILDHIQERKDGGADLDIANTEWRCTSCHNRKTAKARRARAMGQTMGSAGG